MNSHEVLERNLARLRRRLGPLVRAVEEADPHEAEVITGPGGQATVSHGGTLLASAYDPRGEGERMADEMAGEPADLLVAIGFGLGHHLEAYQSRHPIPLVIYEPSPARLRAALSARPMPGLLGRPDVVITTSVSSLAGVFSRFYTPGLRVKVFPHPVTRSLDPEAVRVAVSQVARTKDTLDITIATRVNMAERWAGVTIENTPHFLHNPPTSRLAGLGAGRPAVVVAAGPSLDKQLPLLREYADRVLIIAIGQTLSVLRREGIEPHFVHLVESQNVAHQLTAAGDTENLNLVLLPSCHPGLFELPVRTRWVAYVSPNQVGCWVASSFGESRFMGSGGTVAQTAVFLAAALGADLIALIGQDLAFTDGRTYAGGSVYENVGFQQLENGRFQFSNGAEKRRLFGYNAPRPAKKHDLIWVPGWHGDKVPTSVTYASFREGYRDVGSFLRAQGVRVVNCTEGGARIPGLDHEPFAPVLEQHAGEPQDVAARIRAAHDAFEPVDPVCFESSVARARKELAAVEREARGGLEGAEKAPDALRRARAPQRKIDILRRIARQEKRVHRRLAAVSWIDNLIQAGIHRVVANARGADAVDPTPETAVGEALLLFETALAGVEKARALLGRFEERLAQPAELTDAPVLARAQPARSQGSAPSEAQPPVRPGLS